MQKLLFYPLLLALCLGMQSCKDETVVIPSKSNEVYTTSIKYNDLPCLDMSLIKRTLPPDSQYFNNKLWATFKNSSPDSISNATIYSLVFNQNTGIIDSSFKENIFRISNLGALQSSAATLIDQATFPYVTGRTLRAYIIQLDTPYRTNQYANIYSGTCLYMVSDTQPPVAAYSVNGFIQADGNFNFYLGSSQSNIKTISGRLSDRYLLGKLLKADNTPTCDIDTGSYISSGMDTITIRPQGVINDDNHVIKKILFTHLTQRL